MSSHDWLREMWSTMSTTQRLGWVEDSPSFRLLLTAFRFPSSFAPLSQFTRSSESIHGHPYLFSNIAKISIMGALWVLTPSDWQLRDLSFPATNERGRPRHGHVWLMHTFLVKNRINYREWQRNDYRKVYEAEPISELHFVQNRESGRQNNMPLCWNPLSHSNE